jgi:NADP-dependent 3-hydroxy acid dehydrogenase YdfG
MLLKDKVFIVTGASSGIGEELCKQLSINGSIVVCAARRLEEIQRVSSFINSSGGRSIAVKTDITKIDQCKNMIDQTINEFGKIDSLILNAGISMWAKFEDIEDISFFYDLINTNYMGAVNCCHVAIPFLKRTNGKIVSCSTAQAIMGFPNHSGYVASKHALHGFLETISMEHKGEVSVLEAVLSWIRGTNLRGNAYTQNGNKKEEPRKHTNESVSLDECVKSIIDGVKKDKKTIYIPKKLGLIPFLSIFFKGFLEKKVIRAINKNKH